MSNTETKEQREDRLLEEVKIHTAHASLAAERYEAWSRALWWLQSVKEHYTKHDVYPEIEAIHAAYKDLALKHMRPLREYEASERSEASRKMELYENS